MKLAYSLRKIRDVSFKLTKLEQINECPTNQFFPKFLSVAYMALAPSAKEPGSSEDSIKKLVTKIKQQASSFYNNCPLNCATDSQIIEILTTDKAVKIAIKLPKLCSKRFY